MSQEPFHENDDGAAVFVSDTFSLCLSACLPFFRSFYPSAGLFGCLPGCLFLSRAPSPSDTLLPLSLSRSLSCAYVCVFMCMYVCVYACMYARIHDITNACRYEDSGAATAVDNAATLVQEIHAASTEAAALLRAQSCACLRV